MNILRIETKRQFIRSMLLPARTAIGDQHGWLVRWAIGKAGIECGWDTGNILITRASNCLGIKAEINGKPIDGVPSVLLRANTGPEAGNHVYWREFLSITDCYAELVRMWNDRTPYDSWRDRMLGSFEFDYTSGLKSHIAGVRTALDETTQILQDLGIVNAKGRF